MTTQIASWFVDSRNEVREFLVSRGARITPEQAGLPVYGGNRRVPGLRREEVALLTGVSIDYYTRLERGNVSGVSESVLEAVAHALQLDEAERAYLFEQSKETAVAEAAERMGRYLVRLPGPSTDQRRVRQQL